ncbi:hypothetical protein MBLNU13_g05545t1 [Cladosporium sp. NU13]
MSINTPMTKLLGIKHPIILAGMYIAGSAELVAAVSNSGGMGVVGGLHFTPAELKQTLQEVKAHLRDPDLPFGVDLLLPQVGGSARKTNIDYTRGHLDELIDIVVESNAKLFVSAVGVAPEHVVEKLHANGILYMNLVGHPKHVVKACTAGADIICAQGSEAGGHTSEIPTSVLVPACADLVKQYVSPLTGEPVSLVAAGGICDGRGIAASLMYGASAVWVGTRFVAAVESGATQASKKVLIEAGFDSTIRSTIWTGRPLRAAATPYIRNWEQNRRDEISQLQSKGHVPLEHEFEVLRREKGAVPQEVIEQSAMMPMSIASGLINRPNQSAAEIIDEMMDDAIKCLAGSASLLGPHTYS